jgi:hypothetical protein
MGGGGILLTQQRFIKMGSWEVRTTINWATHGVRMYSTETPPCTFIIVMYKVLRIHEILVWIRIRRYMPLTNGWIRIRIRILDPDPAIYVIDLQYASKKLIFSIIFSAYYFLKVHLHVHR